MGSRTLRLRGPARRGVDPDLIRDAPKRPFGIYSLLGLLDLNVRHAGYLGRLQLDVSLEPEGHFYVAVDHRDRPRGARGPTATSAPGGPSDRECDASDGARQVAGAVLHRGTLVDEQRVDIARRR